MVEEVPTPSKPSFTIRLHPFRSFGSQQSHTFLLSTCVYLFPVNKGKDKPRLPLLLECPTSRC